MASGRVPNTTITFFGFFKFLLPSIYIEARGAMREARKLCIALRFELYQL